MRLADTKQKVKDLDKERTVTLTYRDMLLIEASVGVATPIELHDYFTRHLLPAENDTEVIENYAGRLYDETISIRNNFLKEN